ncbi:hypothetical protein KP004_14845 [Geomonas oryzisoli]|uniref:Cytochrome c domain-containing protein n=1 Tax=Geomonas oryzisoli TaxID=2847992 RepID=A0ABX8J5Q4_9BACT|nr:hypothetical protein [Geomonas oryzisoli]QWV92471.1 hypothetical protein KP004_14845 [Geomonas oryzisoli]
MFKKGIAAAGCLAVVAAGWSYAATTWQVQTKLSTAGGTIQVRDKALQTSAGSTAYNNFTTSTGLIPVKVAAKPGYKITTIYKSGVAQAVTDPNLYSVDLQKAGGLTQSVVASFAALPNTVTGAVIGSGTISPSSATVYTGGSTTFAVTPATKYQVLTAISPAGLPMKDMLGKAVTLPYGGGTVNVTLSNVQASQTVTATFATASVSAGTDNVVATSTPVTLQGTAGAGATIAWAQVSGPAVDTTGWTTATPSFTPATAGTYVFKATESLMGLSDTVQITATGDMDAYVKSACDGCHNATTGVVPSNAYNGWKVSDHKTAGINCITCHTDGAMPTPANTKSVNPDTFIITGATAGNIGDNYCDKCHNGVRTFNHDVAVVPTTTCSNCHTPHYYSQNGQDHFAGLPSTGSYVDGTQRTAYVTQGATCVDCHNPLSNDVNKGYAEGGHGKISDSALNAFAHYDWSARTNNGTRQNGNCDRCHTTGGFLKLLGSTDATRLAPQTGVQNVLACVSCHSDFATGALRTGATPAGNPTALTGGYFALFSSAASAVPAGKTKIQVQFPGYKNSSICIPCHSGRSTDDVFVAVIDQAKAVGGNYTTISTSYYQHAANMGQTFIGKGAYNFDGVDFVGTNGHAGVKNNFTDTEGPCVGCHYSKTGATHSLEPVGYSEVCGACHRPGFGASDVEEKKAEFDAGVAVLDALIRSKMASLQTKVGDLAEERANVRFGRFGKTAGTAADEVTAKNAYGAWYNWQILATYDKAAFAHNPTFARQILMETIDYVDDAKINGSAETTIAASALAAADKEKAEKYVTSVGCAVCHATKDTLIATGKHASEVSTHSGTCGRCHTTEGYTAFLATGNSPTGNYTKTALAGNPSFNGLDNAYNGSQNVSCAACHDQHGTVRNVAWNPQPKDTAAAPSVEYKLCTSCHNLTDASGNVMASGLLVNGTQTVAKQQHYKDWYRNIASTHYDLPSTGTTASGTTIEGYNVRYNSATACTDCHGHEFYTNTNGVISATPTAGTIQTEWAQSGHAGKILSVKFAAFTTAGNSARNRTQANNAAVQGVGVTAATGMAWEHYNWDDSTGTASDRKSCQKCHTATGSANYLTNPAAYNPANNDFSHLAQWATAKVSPQNEVLYCWGCHTSAETGALRNPGAVTTADYTFKGANASFPDVGASNVCITCHGGQKSGESITALTTAGNTFTNVSFVNSHYMAAAGLMYVKNGYTNFIDPNTVIGTSTYGKSLTSDADGGSLTSTHRKLGTPAMATDSHVGGQSMIEGGPCATCHYAKGNHELEIGAVAFTEVCVNCHTAEGTTTLTTENFKEVFIEEQAVPFKDAIALALAKLSANYGITYNASAYPYFYDARNANSAVKDWTRGGQLTAAEAEKLMGACFNINLLNRDPAAYVHARTYARRLLYDTIDFLDDKTINMSTGATAIAWDAVKYVKGATALDAATTEDFKYLAGYNRTSGAWNTLERP